MLSNIKKYGFMSVSMMAILVVATLFASYVSADFKAHADQRTYKSVTKKQSISKSNAQYSDKNNVQADDHDTDNAQSRAISNNARQQGSKQVPTDESDSNIPNRDQYLLYGEVSITTNIDGADGVPSSPEDNMMPAPSTEQHPINEGE